MHILNRLSVPAKHIVYEVLDGNLGIIRVNENYGDVFLDSDRYGRYVIREYNEQGERTPNVWLLLNSGSGDDSGNLLGFLRKTAEALSVSFWYKYVELEEFSIIKNPDSDDDKYDIGKNTVLLESVRSFHSRYTQRW